METVRWFHPRRKTYLCAVVIGLGTVAFLFSLYPVSEYQIGGTNVRTFNLEERFAHDLDIAQRFEVRARHATEACQRARLPEPALCHGDSVKNNLVPVGSHNMTFCSIEKAGSTFWKRILKAVLTSSKSKKSVNPFDIGRGSVYATVQTLHNISMDAVRARMGRTRNVVFVRDPFTRVFSGYLDKLYDVNTYYWFGLGTQIVKAERTHPSDVSLECGHDVTFPEFVTALLKKLQEHSCVDGHFSSSYSHCFPCNYTYDYIGKYETLKEDVFHILSTEGMMENINIINIGESNDIDSFNDGTNFAFQNKAKVQKCMPFVDGLNRFWKRLQARGMLDKRSIFPFNRYDEETITQQLFKETLINAYREYEPEDRVSNRQEALSEAYRSLDESLVGKFREVFHLDFEIFGYNNEPPITDVTDYKYLTFEYD